MAQDKLELLDTQGPGGVTIRIGKPGYKSYVEQEHYLGGPFVIASVRVENEKYESIEEETRRYAELFRAAPELLEALQRLQLLITNIGALYPNATADKVSWFLLDSDTWRFARKALAKAEGKE